ncbi:VOC family protein [Mesorhizobium sp. 1B3]|uniref:VOC family protein n=1 Tax=Mesorhizobium sp. 1B3 TaxID=3243599 RepID=UPI003D98853C
MTDFDHAVINVLGRMDEAAEQYARLGFTLTPRGYHTLGSINHLAVFRDSYLELLGYAPGERDKRAEMWVHPAGLTGLAFRTGNAASLHDDLQRDGVAVEQYRDFSRPVTIDGQERNASFRTFQVDRRDVDNGRIFFCQHNTPELIWRPEWQSHANGATGIAAFTIISNDPNRLSALLKRVPGIYTDGTMRAGRTTLRVFHPSQMPDLCSGVSLLPDLAGGAMRMVALDLFTESLDVTNACLDARGVPYLRERTSLSIAPDAALGLVLRFIEYA